MASRDWMNKTKKPMAKSAEYPAKPMGPAMSKNDRMKAKLMAAKKGK